MFLRSDGLCEGAQHVRLPLSNTWKNARQVPSESLLGKSEERRLRYTISNVHHRFVSVGEIPREILGELHDKQVFHRGVIAIDRTDTVDRLRIAEQTEIVCR